MRYYLDLLRPETMKLLGSTKNKITKNENGETAPHLEVSELALVHCNIFNYDYKHNSRILYAFISSKAFDHFFT